MPEKKITLTVVDQSPLRKGGTAQEALRETVHLAMAAERAGYARYWVAEHHNTPSFAGTSPEILIGQIAARTVRIRVGSGGVMLTHYSALKVAEQFSVLNSFYPGRIDLGIGRAPGSDRLTSLALSDPRPEMDLERFPSQVEDLLAYLHGFGEGADHPFAALKPYPGAPPEKKPEVWLLGSSSYSAGLAAALGLPFAFAEFFGLSDIGPRVAQQYREHFRPSRFLAEPKVNVTLQVVCAPTTEEAKYIASSRQLARANRNLRLGLTGGLLPPDEALAYPLTPEQREYINGQTQGTVDGDPDAVRKGILQAAEDYGTTDIGVVTNCYKLEDRVRSYRLVAEAMGLKAGM